MQVNATDMANKDTIIRDLNNLLLAMVPVERAYLSNKTNKTTPLPPATAELAEDAHQLLCASDFCKGLTALKTAVAAAEPPAGDIRSHIESYRAFNLHSELPPIISKAVQTINESLEEHPDQTLVQQYKEMASEAEGVYEIALPRNQDGVPILWWNLGTTTEDIFKLAKLAWIRIITQCDITIIAIIGCAGPDKWWVILCIWIRHYCAHGNKDALSSLPLDFSGESHSPTKPTLAAHIRHHQLIEPGTPRFTLDAAPKGCVQSKLVNYMIMSDRVGTVAYWMGQTLTGCVALLRRCKGEGLISVSDQDLESLANRGPSCESWFALVRTNGVEPYEVVE